MFILFRLTLAIIAVIVFFMTTSLPVEAQYQFTSFDFPGADATQAFGINNSGTIVGGYSIALLQQGFLQTGAIYTPVSISNAVAVELAGINAAGVAVGNYFDSSAIGHGFVRQSDGTITPLPDYSSHVSLNLPAAINSAGTIVGVYSEDPSANLDTWNGFIFNNGVYTTYDAPGAQGTQLTGINDAGKIVLITDNSTHSYLLDGGVLTDLNFPGADATQAFGINNANEVVGNYSRGGIVHGFLWDQGHFTTLDFPGGTDTRIFDINDQGVIVGTYDNFTHGFIAQPGSSSVPETSVVGLIGAFFASYISLLVYKRVMPRRTEPTPAGSV